MKTKIIFFINSIQQQRCIKRIEEFIANGYEIEAYGFNRAQEIPTLPTNFTINIIGSFDQQMSYLKRLWLMFKTMKPIINRYSKENVIYYFFLLDVAMIGCLFSNKPYIYEESDLMQTYLPRPICTLLNKIDHHIIRNSLLTTMTSEGFIQYHFGNATPENVVLVPNRLNSAVQTLPFRPSTTNIKHLRIGFVGGARYESIVRFSDAFLRLFSQHELHFYGVINDNHHALDFERIISSYPNVFYHGKFSNPQDLPTIYENIDIVLATYDYRYENVRYAEPNKLYEAAYFETPIIVSSNTFLAQKTHQWGIGFSIDPFEASDIENLFKWLTQEELNKCIANCRTINKQDLINNNPQLFKRLFSLQ